MSNEGHTMNKHNERAELPQRGTADEQAKDLWELYLKAAKISGSSLLANEPCPESDKAALYRIACDVLNGIGCVYYDITGEWPNLNAPHKAAAMLEAQRQALNKELPVVVHVRKQRPGEQHVSTREGITPIKPDDLIMRGFAGEEYPIGRELFERTYTLDTTQPAPPAQPAREWVGLTDDERHPMIKRCAEYYGYSDVPLNMTAGAGFWFLTKDVESKLKEKNGN